MKTICFQGDADNFKGTRVGIPGDFKTLCRGIGLEQRRAAGGLDAAGFVAAGDRFLDERPLLRVGKALQPLRHQRVVGDGHLTATERLGRHRAFDAAQRHRQHPALGCLHNAERCCKLCQGRKITGLDRQRKPRCIGERPAGIIGQTGGQFDAIGAALGERRLERQAVEGAAALRRLDRRQRAAIGADQPDRQRLRDQHIAAEADADRLQRRTGRRRIAAAAVDFGGEGRPHLEIEAFCHPGGKAIGGDDIAAPTERYPPPGGQRAAAFGSDNLAFGGGRGIIIIGLLPTGGDQQAFDLPVFCGTLQDRIAAGIGQDIDRHRLAHAVDQAGGMGGNAFRCWRRIQGEEEHLIFGDAAIFGFGQRRANGRAAGAENKAPITADERPRSIAKAGFEIEDAALAAGQCPREIHHPMPRIGPACRRTSQAIAGGRRRRLRVAHRHHRRAEGQAGLFRAFDIA